METHGRAEGFLRRLFRLPTLRERRHRGLVRRLVGVRRRVILVKPSATKSSLLMTTPRAFVFCCGGDSRREKALVAQCGAEMRNGDTFRQKVMQFNERLRSF